MRRDVCPVCGSGGPFREHRVPACRYGPGPRVPYRECGCCSSLFHGEPLDQIAEEYGSEYYSMQPADGAGGLRARVRALRDRHAVAGAGRLGAWLARLFPPPFEGLPELLRAAGAEREARILDVGSGAGELLVRLRDAGYRDLTGIDPYLPEGRSPPEGIRLVRAGVEELDPASDGPYDVMMFHHSLEHVPDPGGALRAARSLLAPGGRVLVRTPVVPCAAWERYGTLWVQLDAPRHLTIFSRTGLPLLASRRAGLELVHTRDDSTEIQFLGSELYREGRPLDELSSRFGWNERRRRRREARRLNAAGRGDQAAFVFRATEAWHGDPPGEEP